MSGVILHRTIATRHEFLNPRRNLCEHISKYNSISPRTSFHGPLLLLTLTLYIIDSCKQIIQFGGGPEVDASLIFVT